MVKHISDWTSDTLTYSAVVSHISYWEFWTPINAQFFPVSQRKIIVVTNRKKKEEKLQNYDKSSKIKLVIKMQFRTMKNV